MARDGYVYFLVAGDYTKIGRTSNLTNRIRTLNIQLPFKAELIHAIRTDDPGWLESLLHREFCRWRRNGEWFFTGGDRMRTGLLGRWIKTDYWDSELQQEECRQCS